MLVGNRDQRGPSPLSSGDKTNEVLVELNTGARNSGMSPVQTMTSPLFTVLVQKVPRLTFLTFWASTCTAPTEWGAPDF